MIIDTIFEVGDDVCYLSGDNIYYSHIEEIKIEMSRATPYMLVYRLADGLQTRSDGKRLFKNKTELLKYLNEL